MIHYEPNRAPFTEYIGAGLLDGVVIRKEVGSYVRASPETEAKWDFSDMSDVDRASYELPEYMPANYLVQSAITQRYGTVKAKQCSEAGYTEPTIDLFSSFVNIGGVDILLKYFKEGTAYSEICKADVLRYKFIRRDYHYVKEAVTDGIICPRRVDTLSNIADIFTKPLSRQYIDRLRPVLTGYAPIATLLDVPPKPRD